MKVQYSIVGMIKGVVVGIDYVVEVIIGFFIKYGDGGIDINLIFCLNKCQGKQLLVYFGCLEYLYKKLFIVDLEDDCFFLLDEVVLGVIYENIDDYLEGKMLDLSIVKMIEGWYLKIEYKCWLLIIVFDDFWKKQFFFLFWFVLGLFFVFFVVKMVCYIGWIDSIRSYCGQKVISFVF